MAKYLFKRLLHGLVSIVIVVAIVMVMIYSLLDRNLIFAQDSTYSHMANNAKVTYRYQRWEEYGYLDYVTYSDYLNQLVKQGTIDADTRSKKKRQNGKIALLCARMVFFLLFRKAIPVLNDIQKNGDFIWFKADNGLFPDGRQIYKGRWIVFQLFFFAEVFIKRAKR